MKATFDDIAFKYDSQFTNTPIGKLQRESVHDYLRKTYKEGFPSHVLELNCGTGEDAVFFASQGSNVVATDISENMLRSANEKIRQHGLAHLAGTRRLDITRINDEAFDHTFDLVFSDFGGLNCVDSNHLALLFEAAASLLKRGGRLILIIMPRFCAWESLYFLSRLDLRKAFRRRLKKAQQANLGNESVDIWYHDPAEVAQLASGYFKMLHIQPIGLTIPPSYLNNSFIATPRILRKLDAAEKKLNKFRQLSRMADHYLIDLELK